MCNQSRILRLYRYLAPVYTPLRPFWAGTTNRAAENYLEQVALPTTLHPEADVLDLGCGPGTNLARLRRLNLPYARYVGIDLSSAMLAARESTGMPAGDFIASDAHSLPFAPGSFDIILSTWMFSHLPEPTSVMDEARRLLRPGGWLIVTCFARPGGLLLAMLGLVEPLLLMRLVPPNEIQTWPGRVELKTFARGCNLVACLQMPINPTKVY
jgi:SAM-dependent methyltransferase